MAWVSRRSGGDPFLVVLAETRKKREGISGIKVSGDKNPTLLGERCVPNGLRHRAPISPRPCGRHDMSHLQSTIRVTTQTGVVLGTRADLGPPSPSSAGENTRAQRVVFRPCNYSVPQTMMFHCVIRGLPSRLGAFVPSLPSPPQHTVDRHTPSTDVRALHAGIMP